VRLIQPWSQDGRAAALDSTALRAKGGVWHKKHREEGIVPHISIDTEAHWSKSGHHGWWYGWKLHLACTVSWVWIPLAARLTAANVHDSIPAPALIAELPLETRFVLGDNHCNAGSPWKMPTQQSPVGRFGAWSLPAHESWRRRSSHPSSVVSSSDRALQRLGQERVRVGWSCACQRLETHPADRVGRSTTLPTGLAALVRAGQASCARN